MTLPKHLYLIDGYGFVFRAYHAIRPLTNGEGVPVNAVFGFTRMLMNIRKRALDEGASSLLVVFDAGKTTFRNDIYAEYKANRPPAPEDLIPQFELVRQAARAMNLPSCAIAGFEADDIIATYAAKARKDGTKVTIVSSDKDLMQLVDDRVEMYDAMKDRVIQPAEVEEKFGVAPAKVLDMLALMGDSSDNIPGVPGIGPKTAAELLNQFGTLEELLARAEEIPQKKRRESLIEFADQALLSKQLAALHYDVPVPFALHDLMVQPADEETLSSFLNQHGFKSLLAAAGLASKPHQGTATAAATATAATSNQPITAAASSTLKPILIESPHALEIFLQDVTADSQIALLPLLHGAHHQPKAAGIWLVRQAALAYVPLHQGHFMPTDLFGNRDDDQSEGGVSPHSLIQALTPALTEDGLLKVTTDAKALRHFLACYGAATNATIQLEDVCLMAYAHGGTRTARSIPALAEAYLTQEITLPDWFGKKPEKAMEEEPQAIMDALAPAAYALLPLYAALQHSLIENRNLTLYYMLEKPLSPILYAMERRGILLDRVALQHMSQDFATRMAALEKSAHQAAGKEFSIGSPKQLGEILFDDMSIEGGKKSKKSGQYSTDSDVLEKLAVNHPIAGIVLDWRMLAKLKSTYTDTLAKLADVEGRVHTTFSMTATSTGRLSSLQPNVQNIPIRTEEGRKIRTAFRAGEGMKLIGADYSQIELRLLAHIADMDSLKNAFKHHLDIHAATASQVFGVPLQEITPELRRRAKTVNFGIIYGQSAFGLAKQLGISRTEAATLIEAYFKQYPGIQTYMDSAIAYARKHGHVLTLLNRRCEMAGINSKNPSERQFAERAAINAPLQGSAADIIKKAMVELNAALQYQFPQARLLLQVHDELLIEAPENQAEEVAKLTQRMMQNTLQLSVPLTVDVAIGDHWGEVH